MSATPNLISSLHWVQGELAQSLKRVRALIEQHLEAPNNQLPLQQAVVEMHQVRGTASMIQCSGLVALTDEMKAVLQDLLQSRIVESEAAYAALLGTTVQMADYVDALATGLDDSVLVFQPVINELRLARGKPVLSEAELFAEQMVLAAAPVTLPPGEGRRPGSAQAAARKFQLVYQQNLLLWMKGQDVQLALGRIGKVAEQIAATATEVPVYQLWRIIAAVAEAMLTKGLEDSPELKRLYGRAAAQLKALAEQGESTASVTAGSLPYQFLYYVGRSKSQGPRVSVLRNAYALSKVLPAQETVENLRRKIRGPNTALLGKLSEEIRKDLTQVKDNIDLVVRAGDKAPTDLNAAVDKLNRVAVTLSMLGLPALQNSIQGQARTLAGLNPRATAPTDPVWIDIASALLRVEHTLDDALFRQMRRARSDGEPPEPSTLEQGVPDLDVREGRSALLRETLIDLAKLKGSVDTYLKLGDASALPEAARMLGNVEIGLRMITSERAAGLAAQLRNYLSSPAFAGVRVERAQAERFADAVATIEYYLEALQSHAPDAEQAVDTLASAVERLEISALPVPADQVRTAAPPAPSPPPPASTPDEVDPEIRDIFLEEAAEVLGQLKENLPRGKRDGSNKEVWTDIRRSFHTLKGSGRMVGARDIGEFAWSVENLLNRCLEGTRPFSPEIIELVESAVLALPTLIDCFRDRTPSPQSATTLQNQAHRLAKGDVAGPDQDLLLAFCNDARERLAAVRAWVAKLDRGKADFAIEEEVLRAVHTLRGSAALINAQGIGGLSGEFENYLNALMAAKMRLPQAGMQLLADAEPQMSQWVERLAEGSLMEPDLKPWLRRLSEVQAALPVKAIEAAAILASADHFANEAFTRLEDIERVIKAWRDHPSTDFHARELQGMFRTLQGDAVTSLCEPLGRAAEAFQQRLGELTAEKFKPDAPFFQGVAHLIEGMYCQLDDFREAKLGDDGRLLAARIARLATSTGDEPQAVAEEFIETQPAIEMPPVIETSSALEVPPVAEADEPVAAAELPRYEEAEVVGAETLEAVDVAEPSAAETLEAEVDPELLAIFLTEADELLENIDRQFANFERDPGDKEPLAELARALHTLKGGARMSGLAGLGDVSHHLETLLEQVAQGRVARDETLKARLRHAMDGLYHLVDQARRGERLDAAPVLSALAGDAPESGAVPADTEMQNLFASSNAELLQTTDQLFDAWEREPHSSPIVAQLGRVVHTLKGNANTAGYPAMGQVAHQIKQLLDRVGEGRVARDAALFGRLHNCMDALHEMLAQIGRGETPDASRALGELEGIVVAREAPSATVMDIAAVAQMAPPTPPAPEGFEPELAEIFKAESAELLEALEKSLARWQADAHDGEALRDIQRALHTLKGGARMAGLMAMGTLAHDMESRVEEIAEARGPVDASALTGLHSQLEQLQRMQDLLARGDAAALAAAPAVEPVVASGAVPAVALEPKVEHYPEPPPAQGPAAPEPAAIATAPLRSPWSPQLFWQADESHESMAGRQRETARVTVEQLDKMLNEAGEISIFRARLEQHNSALGFQLGEIQSTLSRVRDHLRAMDIEIETQIAARGFSQQIDRGEKHTEFDPLEMDRYSRTQELSRTLSESIGDLAALRSTMEDQLSEADTLLMQQGRVNTEIQQGLMATLMVPFSRQVQRLQRVVRQTAQEVGKQAEARFDGIEQELDRNVLERMVAPLEHLLRNSVVHGIELPQQRRSAGKPDVGLIQVNLHREGTQLAIEVRDDGKGLDYAAIRRTAVERGLMAEGAKLRDQEVAMFIFEAGFSTAKTITQAAGRGVGMDVVASEVKQLGGTLELSSESGKGTRFLIRLPLTLALSQTLLVGVGTEAYAIPLPTIESIARLPRDRLADYIPDDGPPFTYGGQDYRVRTLGNLLETPNYAPPEDVKTLPAVLVRLGEGLTGTERRVALVVDQLFGNREIVSKAVGPQVSSVQGVSGGTILPDGRVVLIIDVPALVTNRARRAAVAEVAPTEVVAAPLADERQTIMVVDDSITIRRVTQRLLERAGFRVTLAKDGLDAMAQLQTASPATMLLDIEMPRADGFEVATFVRNNDRLKNLPIIMITSRSGEKHRERARQIGVNRYVIKPYQEEQLLTEVRDMLALPKS